MFREEMEPMFPPQRFSGLKKPNPGNTALLRTIDQRYLNDAR